MFGFGGRGVAVGGVMGTVPVIPPTRRRFLEDVFALGAESIIAQAEILMEKHGPFWNWLEAICASLFIWFKGSRICRWTICVCIRERSDR